VRAELIFEDDEDTDPEEIVEWAAFSFLFTLAVLSFHDARPRGISELHACPHCVGLWVGVYSWRFSSSQAAN